jgi:hydrogenase maturation protein HypF
VNSGQLRRKQLPDVVLQQTGLSECQARRIVLSGQVQGVGFRPYIYRYAQQHGLAGWVRNTSGRVEIHVQGANSQLDKFETSLIAQAPSISKPCIESSTDTTVLETQVFKILDSQVERDADIHLPVDLDLCDACKAELNDPANRRYRYPFINCTQCGPRYTLIESLPYDRANTSMAKFTLCVDCAVEYSDVSNRRYHAEPVACEVCGPALTYKDETGADIAGNEAALQACVSALHEGKIIAIKGIGGYHLICDARNDAAILRLRDLKPRPDKPLAVMFPEAQMVAGEMHHHVELTAAEAELLQSVSRPIVLARKKIARDISDPLSQHIAPGMDTLGVFLPYSPLHHLLLSEFSAPLVATSANLSGEPVLTTNAEVEQRLPHVAQAWLHHNRDIVRPADDSVFRVIADRPRPLRLGRGIAPLEIELPYKLSAPVLAVGCHMKNTIALGWGNRVVISPHIGEMNSQRSLTVFENCIADMQAIYQVQAEHILCDAHPDYSSTRWAQQQSLPVHAVYHHHAHAAVAWYEAHSQINDLEQMLVFTWDGVGLGPDKTLWGGDALLGIPGHWKRVAHFRTFKLPGGERAGREPWRSAAALCWESDSECSLPQAQSALLHSFWQQGKNAPVTTAVGRLFDAAAALVGLCGEASFEGQGPMQLEAIADPQVPAIELELSQQNGTYVADWQVLLAMLQDEKKSVAQRAGCFHSSLAASLLAQAERIREDSGINVVGLSGGVFQNRLLSEKVMRLLRENNFQVFMPERIPVNDAGISFGQMMDFAGTQLYEKI